VIVVDTSVWVSVLSTAGAPEAARFVALLDHDEILLVAPVRTELLVGAGTRDRARLRRLLTALPVAYPTDETWHVMDAWAEQAADRGERFGMGDLLIAAMAREARALIWSLDRDFVRMARLGIAELYN
jgi:predicted nucleic acid-binding protein